MSPFQLTCPVIKDLWLNLMLPSTGYDRGLLVVICVLVRQYLMFGGSEGVKCSRMKTILCTYCTFRASVDDVFESQFRFDFM